MIDDIARHARTQGDAPAILQDGGAISWADLDRRVDITARRMVSMGITTGQVVSAALEPSAEAADILFAAGRIGAVLALMPTDAPGVLIEMMEDQARPVASIDPMRLATVQPVAAFSPDPARDNRERLIVFTSGSHGLPSGIVLTDGNLSANARAAASVLRLLPGDRWLACMPFNHIAAPSIFLRAAAVGFAVATIPTFDAGLAIEAIDRHAVTAVSLVPTMLARMIELGWSGSPGLRIVLLGGGPASTPLLNAALDRGIPVTPTYGMTETASQIATLPPSEARSHLGSVGRPMPGTDVRIADDAERPLSTGAPGRIWVRGPTVASRTLEGPLPRLAGWYGTGDLGRIDADGYLTVLGRIDDVIITGGEKVVPGEVESALVGVAGVADAVVVGVPDAEWGQRAIAVVTVEPGAAEPTTAEIRAAMRDRLVPHKIPRGVVVVDDFPRVGPGKIDRAAVRDLAIRELRDA